MAAGVTRSIPLSGRGGCFCPGAVLKTADKTYYSWFISARRRFAGPGVSRPEARRLVIKQASVKQNILTLCYICHPGIELFDDETRPRPAPLHGRRSPKGAEKRAACPGGAKTPSRPLRGPVFCYCQGFPARKKQSKGGERHGKTLNGREDAEYPRHGARSERARETPP